MSATVTLSVIAGGFAGRKYEFTEHTTCLAGRAPDCDLRTAPDDTGVSRHHCVFEIDPSKVRVRDLGTRNGTFVNGREVGECELVDGDEVRIGRTVIRISVTAAIPGYQIIRELGRGGQGVVYLARRRRSGELVAVKTLLAEIAVDPYARASFLREIEATEKLWHPNVVEFREAGECGAEFFLASEYCEGGSVDRLAARLGGRIPVEDAVPIALGALDGLAYAHRAGLVHRDIKPQNILLAGPVPKLADFGLAKAFESAGLSGYTRTGSVGGSVAFVARAQVLNYKFAKHEVDVWAVAASLYWMLTGSAPRDFPTGSDPIALVLSEPAVPIRERVPAIPRRLAEVIDEALIDHPRIGLGTADDLKLALQDAVP